MAKAKAGAKQSKPTDKKSIAKPAAKEGLLKRAQDGVAKAAAKMASAMKGSPAKPAAKPASKAAAPKAASKETEGKTPGKAAPKSAATKAPAKAKAVKAPAAKVTNAKAPKAPAAAKAPKAAAAPKTPAAPKAPAPAKAPASKALKAPAAAAKTVSKPAKAAGSSAASSAAQVKAADRPRPRATPLPPLGTPLTRREMEQLLTAGQGRGVTGEGSLKGRLLMHEDLPHLVVAGRDKRELTFLLQGPDQELFPNYLEHRVSVSGLIRKTSNYAGTIDVRKYSAKRPEVEEPSAPEEPKLRFLSPGEVSQIVAASMGAGMKGFASVRGQLEMTGDEYIVVLSNAGTRHQVSFILTGKGAKGLRKLIGHTVQVTGVVDKTTGWGGRVEVESIEPRASEFRKIVRSGMKVHSLEQAEAPLSAELKLGEALSVRLQEQAGHTWAIEPMTAKRVALREVTFEPVSGGAGKREFFFTPRNVGTFEIEFFLAKALSPAQVDHSYKVNLTVRP